VADGWREIVEGLNAHPAVISAIEEAAAPHQLFACAKGWSGEIGFAWAPDAYAAFYVGKNGLAVALTPEDARRLTSVGFPLLKSNDTTHYVRIKNADAEDPSRRALVLTALDAAMVKSTKGPTWKRGPNSDGKSAKIQPTCHLHGYELSVTGECTGCDGRPPALTDD
jgi:hypothetical protein